MNNNETKGIYYMPGPSFTYNVIPISSQECAVNDPCCDPESCLLRPWATCRTGACCLNCTVRPSSHVCRQPLTECDVPEFCSGITGKVSGTINIIITIYIL